MPLLRPAFRLSCLIVALAACSPVESEAPVRLFDASTEEGLHDAEALARGHLEGERPMEGVQDLVQRSSHVDRHGTVHVRMDQYKGGVPVFGAQAIVHVPPDGRQIWMTDGLHRELQVSTVPALTEQQALTVAQRHHEGTVDRERVDLQVLRRRGHDFLTWRVQLWSFSDGEPDMPVVFVDAHRGSVVWAYDNLQTARDRDTYDAGNTTTTISLARSEGGAAIGDAPVDDAHDHAGLAYDYYDTFHGRDSYDDGGETVRSIAHYDVNLGNAFWTGTYLVYGDGDTFLDYTSQARDVVVHEFTHAVTEYTAGLIYEDESGGLNEATSDIMGAVAESWDDGWSVTQDTWDVGEDCAKPALGRALRYMDDPPDDGWSIDSYDDYQDGMDVHFSSGIANRAVVAWESSASLDLEEIGEIWYDALANYMTPTTTFQEARIATEQAARDIYGNGADEVGAVADGWDLVDVPPGPDYRLFDTESNLSASSGGALRYTFTPHVAAEHVRFLLIGDDPDADLYVRFGSAPTTSTYDCGSTTSSSRELCDLEVTSSGTWHVLVDAYSSFSGAELTAWEAVPCQDDDEDGFLDCEDDCDDNNDAVYPGAEEVCNEIDDDCDGTVDGDDATDVATFYRDLDGDTFGDANFTTTACFAPDDHVENDLDCDDSNSDVRPGADEVCNGVDDDCSGQVDGDDAIDRGTWFQDADGDSFGDANTSVIACEAPAGFVGDDTDCDDGASGVNPLEVEVCDDLDVDENCNGQAEEPGASGEQAFLVDDDGDGFGDPGTVVMACDQRDGLVVGGGDCDDTDDDVFPGAPESCDDLRDTNCDGFSGLDDQDGDGFAACDECDDASAERYPGAPEACDGIDNDCDDEIDEDAVDVVVFFADEDGDGVGGEEIVACAMPEGAVTEGGDCDDGDEAVFPGADEEPNDGIDQDCDGFDLEEEELGGGLAGCAGCSGTGSSGLGGAWMLAGLLGLALRRRGWRGRQVA